MSLYAFVTVRDMDGGLHATWRIEDGRSGSNRVTGFAEIRRHMMSLGATDIEIRREDNAET